MHWREALEKHDREAQEAAQGKALHRHPTPNGRVGGRFPHYELWVDGQYAGTVRRTFSGGGLGSRLDGWDIGGYTEYATQAEAEDVLIRRVRREN